MRYVLFLILLGVFTSTLSGQDTENSLIDKKEQRKLAREHRQAEKQAEALKKKQQVAELIDSHRFVLKANYINGSRGERQVVSSNLNFIIIDSTEATIQLGSGWGIGYNGVGGITVDGRITKFEVNKKESKKGVSYSVTVYILSGIGQYDVQFWISQNGSANATVRGNYPGSVTYSGDIVALKEARIYKAQPIVP
jgi:hypothetical protein